MPDSTHPSSTSSEVKLRDMSSRGHTATNRALRKLDTRILPLLIALYFAAHMNRANISFEKVAGLERDLHLTGNNFNVAVAMVYASYVFSELPFNLLLKKVGANRWLPFIVAMCGLFGMSMGFVHNFAGLLALRLALGVFVGGTLPGMMLYLSTLYPRHELQKRTGVIFGTACLVNAVGGPLSLAIIKMDGIGGLAGWRWISILEGLATIAYAPLAVMLLPANIETASFLTKDEKELVLDKIHALTKEVNLAGSDQSGTDVGVDSEKMPVPSSQHVTIYEYRQDEKFEWYEVRRGLRDVQLILTGLCSAGIVINIYSLQYFIPTILQGIGYTGNEVQVHSSLPYIPAIFLAVAVSFIADRVRVRGPFILVLLLGNITGYLLLILATNDTQRYAGVFLVVSGGWSSYACVTTVLVNNISGHYKRATTSAVQSVVAHLGGISSGFIYQSGQAPRFLVGHAVALGFAIVAWLCMLANVCYCIWENRARASGRRHSNIAEYEALRDAGKTQAPIGDRHPDFRFML